MLAAKCWSADLKEPSVTEATFFLLLFPSGELDSLLALDLSECLPSLLPHPCFVCCFALSFFPPPSTRLWHPFARMTTSPWRSSRGYRRTWTSSSSPWPGCPAARRCWVPSIRYSNTFHHHPSHWHAAWLCVVVCIKLPHSPLIP